jgi:hypothetical protein
LKAKPKNAEDVWTNANIIEEDWTLTYKTVRGRNQCGKGDTADIGVMITTKRISKIYERIGSTEQ